MLALADNGFKESETYVDHTQTVGIVFVTGEAHFLAAGSVEVAEQAVRSCRTNCCPAVVDFAAAAAGSRYFPSSQRDHLHPAADS